ncbi:biotin-dependent carboxyltransferase family protein [Glaciecola sp. SC05]|uniref:5-oxoprolinase subunit C family protein n=1 Tax=Glaciecola sp. SC05 TaxID=1987355 RepID=UPI003528BFC7
MIEILKVSVYAQLVDAGRRLASHLGYTQSGALDWQSFELGQALLGNHKADAKFSHVGVEVTLGGIEMIFHQAALVALTGAPANCLVDGEAHNMNEAIFIPKGATLNVTNIGATQGARLYLACRGLFDVPTLYGSASNVRREGSGGLHLNGDSLQAGDTLSFKKQHSRPAHELAELVETLRRDNKLIGSVLHRQSVIDTETLQFIPSYQWESFSTKERLKLLSSEFMVSPDCDRMGMRLVGPSIDTDARTLYSQGLCNGAIQCAGNGQLIVMLNDRQTIGGYPVLGAVDGFSRAKLAQKKAGDPLRFTATDELSIAAKRSIWHQQMKNLATWVDQRLSS